MRVFLVNLMLFMFSGMGNVYGADWRFVDSTSASGQDQMQFIDFSTFSDLDGQRVRFWLAGFAQSKVVAYAGKHAKELRPEVSRKLEAGYLPDALMYVDKWKSGFDLSKLKDDDLRRIKFLIIAEQTVDYGTVPALYKVYVELQCGARRSHILDGSYFGPDGRITSSLNGTSTDWVYIAPDSTGEAWLQMVCARKKG